jgi:hypothetical protein
VLAETLLFYNSVHIVADRGLLHDLIVSIGANDLIDLLDEKLLTISFSRTSTAVIDSRVNSVSAYAIVTITYHADQHKRKIRAADEIGETVERALGKSRESKKLTKGLLDRLPLRDVGLGQAKLGRDVVKDELTDPDRLRAYIKAYLSRTVPEYKLPANWDFCCIPASDDGFYILTDLDFHALNREYHKYIGPEHSSISTAFILSHILNAKVDVDLASDYMSEVVTSPVSSDIIRVRFEYLLSRREKSMRDISLFQEVHLDDARAIREVINSGERSFSEFLPVLKKSHRFKQWLAERNPDANLLKEYYEAALAGSWATKLPAKLLRYVFATVAGFANPITGLAAGAADEFLVDRILRGWRPNQFVEGTLKKFTGN